MFRQLVGQLKAAGETDPSGMINDVDLDLRGAGHNQDLDREAAVIRHGVVDSIHHRLGDHQLPRLLVLRACLLSGQEADRIASSLPSRPRIAWNLEMRRCERGHRLDAGWDRSLEGRKTI